MNISKLKKGDTVLCVVTGIKPYGLFVEMLGIEPKSALIHRNNMSADNKKSFKYNYYSIGDIEYAQYLETTEKGVSLSLPDDFGDVCGGGKIIVPPYVDMSYARRFGNWKGLQEIDLSKVDIKPDFCSFQNCINLKKVVLPDNLESIERNTFANCTSLKEINIPDSVYYIGEGAFYGCTSLKSITIPKRTRVSKGAFEGCPCNSYNEEEENYKNNKKLDEIKEVIKRNPHNQVYVKWITSSESIQTSRIFRPLRIHQDGSISLETNGYIYYVFPKDIKDIILIDDGEKNMPPDYQDWFGNFGNDR